MMLKYRRRGKTERMDKRGVGLYLPNGRREIVDAALGQRIDVLAKKHEWSEHRVKHPRLLHHVRNFHTIAERREFQPFGLYLMLKRRIGGNRHPMASGHKGTPHPDERVNVAVRSNCDEEEVHRFSDRVLRGLGQSRTIHRVWVSTVVHGIAQRQH